MHRRLSSLSVLGQNARSFVDFLNIFATDLGHLARLSHFLLSFLPHQGNEFVVLTSALSVEARIGLLPQSTDPDETDEPDDPSDSSSSSADSGASAGSCELACLFCTAFVIIFFLTNDGVPCPGNVCDE